MMHRTHLAFGLLFGIIAMKYFGIESYIFLIGVLFGSIFVDIDEADSYIGRRTWPLSNMAELFFGHRGLLHSLFFGIFLFLLFYFFGYLTLGLGFLTGYLSHLIADALTIEGVRLIYPLSKFTVKGFIRTNGLIEKVFFGLVVIMIVYLFI